MILCTIFVLCIWWLGRVSVQNSKRQINNFFLFGISENEIKNKKKQIDEKQNNEKKKKGKEKKFCKKKKKKSLIFFDK